METPNATQVQVPEKKLKELMPKRKSLILTDAEMEAIERKEQK